MTYYEGKTVREAISKALGNRSRKQSQTTEDQIRREGFVRNCRAFWELFGQRECMVTRAEEQFAAIVRSTDEPFDRIEEIRDWFANYVPPNEMPRWARRAIEIGEQGSAIADAIALIGALRGLPNIVQSVADSVRVVAFVQELSSIERELQRIDWRIDGAIDHIAERQRELDEMKELPEFKACWNTERHRADLYRC